MFLCTNTCSGRLIKLPPERFKCTGALAVSNGKCNYRRFKRSICFHLQSKIFQGEIWKERDIYFDCFTLTKMAQRSFEMSVRRDVTSQKNLIFDPVLKKFQGHTSSVRCT